jgi:HSP20 family protein
MTLVRWNPDNFVSPFEKFFSNFQDRPESFDTGTCRFSPNIDVIDAAERVTMSVELPGLAKEDVKITVENGVLSLSGERKWPGPDKDETYHLREGTYGKFERRFTLGNDIDLSKISAEMDKGILVVTFGKKESSLPKKIEVKVN